MPEGGSKGCRTIRYRRHRGEGSWGGWPETRSVSLLLAPDSQRTAHPSNTLEAERRPLVELRAQEPQLRLDAGTLMRWS